MALHSGIDTIGFVSSGVYSKTYGLGEEINIANLFGFYGLIEDAPGGIPEGPFGKGIVKFKLDLKYTY